MGVCLDPCLLKFIVFCSVFFAFFSVFVLFCFGFYLGGGGSFFVCLLFVMFCVVFYVLFCSFFLSVSCVKCCPLDCPFIGFP